MSNTTPVEQNGYYSSPQESQIEPDMPAQSDQQNFQSLLLRQDSTIGSNTSGVEQEQAALQTLTENWDDLNGRDSITSLDDLTKFATDPNAAPDVRQAAQFYIDNPERFEELDIAAKGGSGDEKVSIGDIRAREQVLLSELNAAENPEGAESDGELDALSALVGQWDELNGRDSIVSLDDLRKLAADENADPALRQAAGFYIGNPDKFEALDIAAFGGESDGKVSIDDVWSRQQQLGFEVPVQQVSSHNSYEKDHTITEQNAEFGVNSFELDIHDDGDDSEGVGAWSVRHFGRSGSTGGLDTYLQEIAALPEDQPISLFLDLKGDPLSSEGHSPEDLDRLLEQEFGDRLFTPEDLMERAREIDPGVTTLQGAMQTPGAWPSDTELEGKIVVAITGDDSGLNGYFENRTGDTEMTAFIAPKIETGDDFVPNDNAVIYNVNANPVGPTDRDEVVRLNQDIAESGNLVRNYGVDGNSFAQLAAGGANFLATDHYDDLALG